MPRADFEMNLTLVQEEIIQLSSMVEKAIYKSVDALKKRDVKASQQVIEEDDLIDLTPAISSLPDHDLRRQQRRHRCVDDVCLFDNTNKSFDANKPPQSIDG